MKRHGVLSLAGKMAAQMRRGQRVAIARPYSDDYDVTTTLPLWGFLFYEWGGTNPDDWSTTNLLGNPFQKGLNWHLWDNFLRTRIASRGGVYANEVINGDASSGTFVPGAGNWIMLKGQANFDMGSAANICVLGNSPPLSHIAEIKRRSQVGTEVHTGLHNFQSVNQNVYATYSRLEAARAVSRGFPIAAAPTAGCGTNGLNRYGCTTIDEYEANATGLGGSWPRCDGAPVFTNIVACPHDAGRHAGLPANAPNFTKHVWECDTTSAAHRAALTAEWVNYCNTYYSGGVQGWILDGMLVDNMRQDIYTGDSTNASPLPAELALANYRAGWSALQTEWKARIIASGNMPREDRFRWANVTDLTGAYTAEQIRNRWVEFFFVNVSGVGARPWSGANSIQEALRRVKAERLRIVLGVTGTFGFQDAWATTTGGNVPATDGTWAQIYAEVASLRNYSDVYAQAFRQTTAGGFAFWQQGWRPIGT